MFIRWIMVLIIDECVALPLAELASRYPTSAKPALLLADPYRPCSEIMMTVSGSC